MPYMTDPKSASGTSTSCLKPHGATIEMVSKAGVGYPIYIHKCAAITPHVTSVHHIYNTKYLEPEVQRILSCGDLR